MTKSIIQRSLLLFILLASHAAYAGTDPLYELRTLATQGNAEAQLRMGGLYFKGEELDQDYQEAARWFRLAARQNNAQACFNLAMLYDTGHGVGLDHVEAVRWYRQAARQGLPIAQLNLGVAHAEGLGGAKNEAEAVRWFHLAAAGGEAQALFNLGVMYANGQGVAQNLIAAYRYTKQADELGHGMARALIQDLARKMTPEQFDLANQAVYVPATPAPAEKIYLQLGAFRSISQAEKFMALLSEKLSNHVLSLHTQDELVRIQTGPYTSTAEAKRSAELIKLKLGIEPPQKIR